MFGFFFIWCILSLCLYGLTLFKWCVLLQYGLTCIYFGYFPRCVFILSRQWNDVSLRH